MVSSIIRKAKRGTCTRLEDLALAERVLVDRAFRDFPKQVPADFRVAAKHLGYIGL